MKISTIKNPNFEKPFCNPSNRTRVNILKKNFGISWKIFGDISPKKFGSAYAQSPQTNFEQQWSRTIFRLSERTLWSRVRIFVIWQELVKFQAAAWLLVAAWILTISWHGGPVQTTGTVRERTAHKSRAAWAVSSLGDCMQDLSHLRGSERELFSQTRRKSAAGDSAEPKQ